ncbi:hypothetical protein ACFL5L_02295 [candidate division KSB1 bacterium]
MESYEIEKKSRQREQTSNNYSERQKPQISCNIFYLFARTRKRIEHYDTEQKGEDESATYDHELLLLPLTPGR